MAAIEYVPFVFAINLLSNVIGGWNSDMADAGFQVIFYVFFFLIFSDFCLIF